MVHRKMKLAVSNIAWGSPDIDEFLRVLSNEGCEGIELSPSMLWTEPLDTAVSDIMQFKEKARTYGLEIPSMHSLTYTRPDLSFFDSPEGRKHLEDYIVSTGNLAGILDIPVMILGSAKSRIIGERNRNECFKWMTESCYRMAERLKSFNVTLLIEPLSRQYTDFINNAEEAMSLVKSVEHDFFALHIDLKSSFEEGENQELVWSTYADYIKHCHVANPGLKPPTSDCPHHVEAAAAIKSSGYDKYISLEISRVSSAQELKRSIAFVKETYFDERKEMCS
jgi:sugar phosphate isomerase/epimerase